MLKTVRCYEIKDSKLLWEEMVTYDTDHWGYTVSEKCGAVRYLGKSNQVPEKPEGMLHCVYTFMDYEGTHLDLSNFDTSDVIDMSGMFYECDFLKSLDLSSFDTSNVINMSCMFSKCAALESLDLSSFNTSNVIDMSDMFRWCESLKSLDLSSFDTSNVTDMDGIFYFCKSLKSLDLSSFDTSDVTDMNSMFSDCDSLDSLDLSKFNTSNVTNMWGMFSKCRSLQSLDLSSFNTSNVTDMFGMFDGCRSLQSLVLSSFNTSNVTDMSSMFYGCESLQSLDLVNFDISNVTKAGMSDIFAHTKLTKENSGLGLSLKEQKAVNVYNKDSIDTIFDKIDELSHSGTVGSPSSLIKDLKSRGYSDSVIVSAIYLKIELGSLDREIYTPVVDSYVTRVIVPLITKYFSNRTVGEVLSILYKKYPEGIVNKAMCSYLSPQYLVD